VLDFQLDKALKELIVIHSDLVDKRKTATCEQTSQTRAVSAPRSTSNSKKRPCQLVTTVAASTSTEPKLLRKKKKSPTIHQRLKRANNNKEVPFVLGKSSSTSFNVHAAAQKNLNIGTESFKKSKLYIVIT